MARDTNGITPELRRQAIDRLFAERCSCVIRNGSDMRVFYERGVKDLYRLLKEEPGLLRGAFVADKVVGKAAGAFRLLSGMRVICSTLYKETAPGYFRPERESVRFGIFSSFFAGSCWNKADCFRIIF